MKKKKSSFLIISLLALCIASIVVVTELIYHDTTPPFTPRNYSEIEASGTLRVVTDYSPTTYYVENDTITGFDYELLQLLSQRSGLKIEIEPEVSLSKSLTALDNGVYDIMARQLPVTTENKQQYIFTTPLQYNKQVLIQRVDSNNHVAIRNQLDLGGCTLYIAQDAPTRLRIENLAHEIGDTIYICEDGYYGAEQLIILVATGEIDYAVCNETEAQTIGATYDNIDYQTDISFTQFMSWTLRQESVELRDSIDKWLQEIEESEAYKSLYTKYFGQSKYRTHRRMMLHNK